MLTKHSEIICVFPVIFIHKLLKQFQLKDSLHSDLASFRVDFSSPWAWEMCSKTSQIGV